MKKEFYKLVRDKIPEIIAATGDSVTAHIITDEREIMDELFVKLEEEVAEFKEAYKNYISMQKTNDSAAPVIEELADVLEVLNGMCYHIPIRQMKDAVEKERESKYRARGGFEKMWFLETTDSGGKCEDN